MSDSAFEVDTAGMRAAAEQIGSTGEQAAQTVRELQRKLASLGQPWGSDDLGKSFAKQYLQPSQDGLKALGSLGDGLQGVAENLSAEADNYDGVEQAVTDAFQKIGTELR